MLEGCVKAKLSFKLLKGIKYDKTDTDSAAHVCQSVWLRYCWRLLLQTGKQHPLCEKPYSPLE